MELQELQPNLLPGDNEEVQADIATEEPDNTLIDTCSKEGVILIENPLLSHFGSLQGRK